MEVLYRVESYLSCSIELGAESRINVQLLSFPVLSKTAKGCWIDVYSCRKFVRSDAKKKYACASIQDAIDSFIARKKRQIAILKKQLRSAEQALVMIAVEAPLLKNSLASGNTVA